MEVIVLIGGSGTGKSYKAIVVAREMDIEYIIDDGLLIKGTKVIAGKSAKREASIVAAVKRAIFMDEDHRNSVRSAIQEYSPDKILIIGTSEKMVDRIVSQLKLPSISKRIYIEHISTEEELTLAKKYRYKEGKHVIPVPTFEIKKDFSGYFIDRLRILRKRKDRDEGVQIYEKSVVRPTFSYLGKYTISHNVIKNLTKFAAEKIKGIHRVSNIYINSKDEGIIIDIDVVITFEETIMSLAKKTQRQIAKEIEKMTSLNILYVNINIKKIIKI